MSSNSERLQRIRNQTYTENFSRLSQKLYLSSYFVFGISFSDLFWKMLRLPNKYFTCFYFVILGPTSNSGMFFYDQRSTCTLPTKFVGSIAEIISSIKKFDIAAKNRKQNRLDKCIYVLVLAAAPLFFKTRIDIKVFKKAYYISLVWGSFFNYIGQILPIIGP